MFVSVSLSNLLHYAFQGRLWWRDAHLLSQPAGIVSSSTNSEAAHPAALVALAAVEAFLHPLWQQHVVDEWR